MSSERCDRAETCVIAELIDACKLEIGDGYRAKNSELGAEGLPFARAGNINSGFDFSTADRVPPVTLAKVGRKRSMPGDVVFTSKGTVGRFAWVRRDTEPFVYSPQLCFWRSLDPDSVDPRFLYYWMQGPECLRQINALKGQTDMADYVSLRDQRTMKITLPPLAVQQKIARVLGSLDDKIDSNRRLARRLDACLREFYIAAARKVESRQPLSEVAAHHKTSVQPWKTPQAEYEHFSIPAFDTGALSEIAQGADILSGKYTFPDDAVALSKLNPATKRVLVRRSVTDLPAICSSEFVVLRPVNGMTTEVLYAVLAHDGVFYSEVLTGVTGTTGSRQRVNPPHVLQSTVPAFDPEQISSLTDAIRPMHEQIRTLHCEAVRLRAIHEALLPKLVSGQIRVPAHEESLDAEAADLVESPA